MNFETMKQIKEICKKIAFTGDLGCDKRCPFYDYHANSSCSLEHITNWDFRKIKSLLKQGVKEVL